MSDETLDVILAPPHDAGPLDRPDRGILRDLIFALLFAAICVAGLLYYGHVKAVRITEQEAAKASALQVAHNSLVTEYSELMRALSTLPVGQQITIGPDGTNQAQWQRIR